MAVEPRIQRLRLSAGDADTLRALLREINHTVAAPKQAGGKASVEAYVPEGEVEALRRRKGIEVELIDGDVHATGRQRQAEVGTGNRFTGEGRVVKGLGDKEKAG